MKCHETAQKSAGNRRLSLPSRPQPPLNLPPMAYNAHLAYYYEKQPELEDLLTSLLDPLIEERAEDPEAFLLAAMQQRAAARLAAANQADAPEPAAADAPEAPLPQAPAPEPAPPHPAFAFLSRRSLLQPWCSRCHLSTS